MVATIDSIAVFRDACASGDDDCFVVARSGRETGWYGPVSAPVASFVRDQIAEVVVGHSVEDHRELYHKMRAVTRIFPSATAPWALGSVDCAVWDLHARINQAPVAALLSAAPAPRVRLYASWLRLDHCDPKSLPVIADIGRAGWSFTKWGLRRKADEPSVKEAKRLARAVHVVAAALGTAAAFDAVFTWDEAFMAEFASRVQTSALLWLEDPLPCPVISIYEMMGQTVPLATGERLMDYDDGMPLLSAKLTALTIDVVGCGGLTRANDLVKAASERGVKVYPHGRSFVPAVHLAAANPDAVPAVEYRLQWEPRRQYRYAAPLRPNRGVVTVPETPGLGARPRSQ